VVAVAATPPVGNRRGTKHRRAPRPRPIPPLTTSLATTRTWSRGRASWAVAAAVSRIATEITTLLLALRIRIRRIQTFLGHQDPLVFRPSGSISQRYGTGSGFFLSSSKNSNKNLDSYCFVTSLRLFIFEKLCKCTLVGNKQKKNNFLLTSWRSLTKIAGSGSNRLRDMDPRIQIRTKISWIRNTACNYFQL
jgi:hypothetical protein